MRRQNRCFAILWYRFRYNNGYTYNILVPSPFKWYVRYRSDEAKVMTEKVGMFPGRTAGAD